MARNGNGAERKRDRVLSEAEIKAIWKALDKERLIPAAAFRLCLLTAQQGGEVHSMRWRDIYGDWWTIPSEFSKNSLSHRVPLSPQAQRIIDQVESAADLQDAKAGRARSEWAFPNPANRAEHVGEMQKLVQRVRRASEVSFRAHDFRCTVASMMAGMGVPRLVVSKILNHVESGATSVYDRHSYDKEKQEALNCWGARLSGIVSDLELVGVKNDEVFYADCDAPPSAMRRRDISTSNVAGIQFIQLSRIRSFQVAVSVVEANIS